MKRYLLPLALLLCALPVCAQTAPTVTDHSTDKTHQKRHERTLFYKADGKTPCGVVAEFKSGQWKVLLSSATAPIAGPLFETRAEAVKWVSLYCPVVGKAGHD